MNERASFYKSGQVASTPILCRHTSATCSIRKFCTLGLHVCAKVCGLHPLDVHELFLFAKVGKWLPLPSCADILQQPAPLASSALLVCRFVPRCVVFTPLLNKRVRVVAKVGKWLPLPSCADIFQQLAPVACCTFLVCIHALSALNYLSASLPSPPGPKSGQRSSTFADNQTNGCAGGEGSRLDHWGGGIQAKRLHTCFIGWRSMWLAVHQVSPGEAARLQTG